MFSSIEAERVRNGWSKEELAKTLGISLKTYYNWVNEETDIPITALVFMSRLFNTDVEYLLKGMSGTWRNENVTGKKGA